MTTDGYALNEIALEMNNAGRFGWSGSCFALSCTAIVAGF